MDLQIQIRDFLKSRFEDPLLSEQTEGDHQVIGVKPGALIDICEALQEDAELEVKLLADINVVDWLGHQSEVTGRFEVFYNLYSIKHQYRFFLSVRLPGDNPEIASLTPLWMGANWMEREMYDMMGITFTGHPNLEKILTPDDLEGHPLRRDFPLTYEMPRFSHNKNEPPEVIR